MSKRRIVPAEECSAPAASPQPNSLLRRLTAKIYMRRILIYSAIAAILITFGVFAKNGWLPSGPDPFTGRRTGWFGKPLPKNASSSWNPLAAPLPNPTSQHSKDYIYAGSRLLAVEDANASASPPHDLAVWRPSTGTWWVLGSQGYTSQQWGLPCNPPTPPTDCDRPVPGDYDGDGKTDFSIFRPSTGYWWIVKSSDGSSISTAFGQSSDIPAPADFDGDRKTDMSVWRPSTQVWYVIPSATGSPTNFAYGSTGDKPVPADYDGDGRADFAVWRASNTTLYSINSSNSSNVQTSFGSSGDTPVPADYDGDGKADLAVWRSSNSTWYIKQSSTGSTVSTQYGSAGDELVPNDYDGDAKVDIAVWRPTTGVWYILKSSTSTTRTDTWGTNGDIPVPAFYRR